VPEVGLVCYCFSVLFLIYGLSNSFLTCEHCDDTNAELLDSDDEQHGKRRARIGPL